MRLFSYTAFGIIMTCMGCDGWQARLEADSKRAKRARQRAEGIAAADRYRPGEAVPPDLLQVRLKHPALPCTVSGNNRQ